MRCRLCGDELLGRSRVWCTNKCKNRWRSAVPSKELQCLACGKVVLVPPARHYRRKYCSKSCADAHFCQTFRTGPNNSRWRGGRAINYGPGWNEVKREVRERDKVCRQCGKTPEENSRALDIHHINPYRYTKDNSLENLIALCRSCHMRSVDRGRRGAAKFAGPQQLELRPPSQRELQRRRGERKRQERLAVQAKARELNAEGQSLRQIGRALGVSHQTISNWLAVRSDADEMTA
jgi:hypothetical protein